MVEMPLEVYICPRLCSAPTESIYLDQHYVYDETVNICRSAHDGMNTSMDSKWKWNKQVPLEETRQYNMYDKTMRKNVSLDIGLG